MANNPFLEQVKTKKRRRPLVRLLEIVVVFTSIFIVLYLFVITPNEVDGPSMEPNFYDGQLLFTNKIAQWIGHTEIGESLGFNYKRGEVVIFYDTTENRAIIKRVIGVPGDIVAIRNGNFYVNNQRLIENYLPPSTYTRGGSYLVDGGESKQVPEGHYFLSGDNRAVSYDSRAFGPVARGNIKGKVIFRFWPPEDIQLINKGSFELGTN